MVKRCELVFKVLYFLLTLLSFNVFFARKTFIPYFSCFIVFFGIIIGLFRLLHIKNYLNVGVFLLLSFIFSYVLGSINSSEFGYIDNIKSIVWMAIQYFLIFAFDKNDNASFEKNILFSVFLGYTFICSIVSLWMMTTRWQYYSLIEDIYWVQGGFIDNRLFGCYVDPNYGAIFSIISIIISLYYIREFCRARKWLKIAILINIVVEYLYLCYSDSRTGVVAISVVSFVYVFVDNLKEKGFIKTIAIGVSVAIVLAGSIALVQKGTSIAKIEIAKISASKSEVSSEEIKLEMDAARVGRNEDQIGEGTDFTNNRIAIWGNAIEMFKQNPIIGISYRNIREYAEANIPDTYVGFESMHNFFFDVLVSQGIVGVLILILLMSWTVITLVKKYLSLNSYKEFAFLIAIIAAIFVSMLTYSETFYMNTGGAFLFWYVLGYLVNYKEKEEVVED